jgi:L-alanine-DL-glutamate epimerase-like enolase superfamily enzyme
MPSSPDMIETVEAFDVRVPLERPLVIGSATVTARDYTVVRVRTAEGIEGVGYTFARGLPMGTIVRDLLAPVAVGVDSAMPEMVRRRLLSAYWPSADHGTFTAAVSALDLALWDAQGKRLGVPLARLLGQVSSDVPVCAVVGYVYDDRDATLHEQIEAAVALGARSIKLVIGGASPERDARRVGLAREIGGPNVLLAVDAFRSFRDLDDAVRRVRALDAYDLSFVEDPFSETLAPLAAELRRRTGARIGLGESLAGHRAIRALIDAGAVDVVRLDALVIGGVREFMSAAALASGAGLSVATHVHSDVHIHFASAIPNLFPGGLEYMPSSFNIDTLHRLLDAPLAVDNGVVRVPDGPGLGMQWNWEAVRRFARG